MTRNYSEIFGACGALMDDWGTTVPQTLPLGGTAGSFGKMPGFLAVEGDSNSSLSQAIREVKAK